MKQRKHLFLWTILLFASLGLAQNYNPIVNYNFNGTPTNGIKIKTNIPFQDGQAMPTITFEGFEYGNAKPIGLTLVWYIYDNKFINQAVSSFGDYIPPIQLSNENGKVVIFINDKKYFTRFTIRGYEKLNSNSTWFQGWTVVDEALTGTNTVTVPYKNSFAGDVNLPGGSIWNSNGNVGVGTTNPIAKFHVNGDSHLIDYTSRLIGHNDRNNYYIGHYEVTGSSGLNIRWNGGIRFSTGAGDNMQILNNGNVGIGTLAPGAKLEVNGNISTSLGAGGKLTLYDNNSTRNNRIELFANEDGANIGSTYGSGGNGNLNFNTVGGVTTMKILENGNVGIGTTLPGEKLEVKGNIVTSVGSGGKLTLFDNNSVRKNFIEFFADDFGGNIHSSYNTGGTGNLNFNTNGVKRMTIAQNGNVGIGTASPQEKFEVNGGSLRITASGNEGAVLSLYNSTKTATGAVWRMYNMTGAYGNSLQFWNYPSDFSTANQRLVLSDTGNMALFGKFQAKELKVTNSPTADFVFEEDYNLPKLENVEKHIKEKKHLPEIASAKEMEKEGVNVGEFQIKLLQKIEELTLYVIEQNKKINELEKEVKALRAKK